ncbi:putative ORFan [Tupanvirus deep ocean]|uniref:ORFan n=2 Tax=Tupanvirus TaxID=2094720 RepID=A0AC62A8G8_9VIRU|nr:putative ORFan [Tupanvirus deep ocean]QKU34076.1 putative ORFan [Tupanvirus deep ocean]
MSESYCTDARDIIFIKSMIDHHKNTVSKSRRISKTSKNPKLQLTAGNLADMLETQISVLNILLGEYDPKIKCVKGSNNEYICAQKPKKISMSKTAKKPYRRTLKK